MHWLRRLIFRSAWLDQRVKEGELDIRFDDDVAAPSSTSSPTAAASRSSSLPSRAGTASHTCAASPAGRRRYAPRSMRTPVWVVIPTYNEAANLERIFTAASAELDRLVPGGYRILIVDDGSPDGTGTIADSLAEEHSQLEVLHRPNKQGLGQAYLAGFARALAGGAELVVEMDADFSHDPRYLAGLLRCLR